MEWVDGVVLHLLHTSALTRLHSTAWLRITTNSYLCSHFSLRYLDKIQRVSIKDEAFSLDCVSTRQLTANSMVRANVDGFLIS